VKSGEIGEVIAVPYYQGKDSVGVDFPSQRGWCAEKSELELVEDVKPEVKKEPDFKVGDFVKVSGKSPYAPGHVGKVVSVSPGDCGIEFHDVTDGHDCGGKGTPNRCWYVLKEYLAKVDYPFLSYRDSRTEVSPDGYRIKFEYAGPVTTATILDGCKKYLGVAICFPEDFDKYDRGFGTELAEAKAQLKRWESRKNALLSK
jgi:hypothetical protein